MPCFARKRHRDMVRPMGMAGSSFVRGVHRAEFSEQSDLLAALGARLDNKALTPETSTISRRPRRSGWTTPMPAAIASGQPRNEEGSCGNEQF
jgi:hypothetical protein